MPPGIFYQTSQIWTKPTRSLGSNGFPFDRLMTLPTILSPTKLWHSNHCDAVTLEFWFFRNMNPSLSDVIKKIVVQYCKGVPTINLPIPDCQLQKYRGFLHLCFFMNAELTFKLRPRSGGIIKPLPSKAYALNIVPGQSGDDELQMSWFNLFYHFSDLAHINIR